MSREQRFVFGEVADLYERARPGYPAALVDDVLASTVASPRVLEVGAGTGKATAAFAARGVEIVALEPTPEMAAVVARMTGTFPAITVEQATFEDWRGALGSFDLVYAAQSWHWLRPEARCRKAHEVLRPGGLLAIFWNVPAWDDEDLRAGFREVYDRHAPELNGKRFPALTGVHPDERDVDDLRASGLFEPVTTSTYRWSERYTLERYLDLLSTHSDHRMLPEATRWAVLEGIAAVIERRGGSFVLPYDTVLYRARNSGS